MKLDDWLTRESDQGDRLRVIERLAQAINEAHDRGEPLAALEPTRIDVDSDLRCDLTSARHGSPAPAYTAPERSDGGPASPESDVYVAGLIFWEILAGRAPGSTPGHLADVRADLPRELADAVMACLERSAEWRPKDLTYVAQLAQQAQSPRGGSPARAGGAPRAGATARPSARPPSFRTGGKRESRSQLPLVIAAVLVVALAGGSYYWLKHQPTDDESGSATARPRTTSPSATAVPAASSATPGPAPRGTPAPTAQAATLAASATPTPATAPAATPTPTSQKPLAPVATPTPTPAPANPAPRTPPATSETTLPDAAPPPASAPATSAGAPPKSDLPSEPPVAATISPLTARRPGKVLFDVRGANLHAALRARVLPLRQAPQGISVVRQKCADATLVNVLLDFDATVAPGSYALVLEDAAGRQTKPLTFTVTK